MTTDDEHLPALTRDEHNEDAHAKRTIIRAQDPATGDWVNIAAKSAGDGTFGLPVYSGLIPISFDRISFSNADANGNYQTGTVKKSGSTVGTLTLAYDASSNLTDIHFT